MKKFICVLLSVLILSTLAFSGCFTTNKVEVTVENEYTQMTDDQWEEYKDILEQNGTNQTSLQANINYSLLCGVSILTRFEYNDVKCYTDGAFGSSSAGYPDYHMVYCGAGVIVEMDKDRGDAYVITNCHVVFDDSSKQIISNDVRLYLYGQDTEGVNYTVDRKYVTYNGKKVWYTEDDGNDYYLLDYGVSGDEKYRIPATVVGASVTYDIALLKISNSSVLKNSDARVAQFAESDEVYVGEQVYAVGNPEGDGMSATVGFINKESEDIVLNLSEKNEDGGLYRVIRTDAAVNGGNSGGAMYNAKGEIVGIINSKNAEEDIDNMAYALPGSMVKRLWKLMKEDYESKSPYFKAKDPYVKAALFPAEYQIISSSARLNIEGYAEIVQTIAVSKAGGGLLVGDVLQRIKITDKSGKTVEDKQITRNYHIDDTLLSAREGYTVTFTIKRGNQTQQISYTATLQRSNLRK